MNKRFPAEWEAQDGVLLGWPHEKTDWAPNLPEVLPVFVEIAKAIASVEKVIIPAPQPEKVVQLLDNAGVDLKRVKVYQIPTNDTWARDYGFLTLYEQESPQLLDFGFNGWGLKFAANLDNQINRQLLLQPGFSACKLKTMNLVFEGGSIESDGNGLLLTTAECLLSPNRNPWLSREEIQRHLLEIFQAEKVLWLDYGYLAGDDTDSHIDTLARLCPHHTMLYVACSDKTDEHYSELRRMEEQLKSFTNLENQPFKCVPLPFPAARYDEEGQRLPATYANYLVINGAVLVPTYQDPQDEKALETLREVFPDRKIIGINCLPIIKQHGSLHCLTMQIPKGVL